LPVKGSLKKIADSTKFQEQIQQYDAAIVNEFSMVGQTLLTHASNRLNEGRPSPNPGTFGKLPVLLSGDPGQLRPVDQPLLWDCDKSSSVSNATGHALYNQFKTVVKLDSNMRIDASDTDRSSLLNFQEHLRDGAINQSDFDFAASRTQEALGDDFARFNGPDAVHILMTNNAVAKRNNEVLKSLNQSIIKVEARHSGRGASQAPADKAGLLLPFAYLARGAKVMLTSNLWLRHNLANESTDIIRDFHYGNLGQAPYLPETIIVEVDGYDRPPFLRNQAENNGYRF
jgi:hypothetical protein